MSLNYLIYLMTKKYTILNFKVRYLENCDFLNFYLFLKKSLFLVFIWYLVLKFVPWVLKRPIYIYMYVCVRVCMYVRSVKFNLWRKNVYINILGRLWLADRRWTTVNDHQYFNF